MKIEEDGEESAKTLPLPLYQSASITSGTLILVRHHELRSHSTWILWLSRSTSTFPITSTGNAVLPANKHKISLFPPMVHELPRGLEIRYPPDFMI